MKSTMYAVMRSPRISHMLAPGTGEKSTKKAGAFGGFGWPDFFGGKQAGEGG